jgi:putative endonuclease
LGKTTIGQSGEQAAAEFLEKKGYTIVARNCRLAGTEIDIIAEKDRILCFIEVKTRKSDDHGSPEEFVDPRKIKKLIRGAKLFSARKKFRDCQIRFDIVGLVGSAGRFAITHLEDAFEE